MTRHCPDDLECQHSCGYRGCKRVAEGVPLSLANYQNDVWPAAVIQAQFRFERTQNEHLQRENEALRDRIKTGTRDLERARGIAATLEEENARLQAELEEELNRRSRPVEQEPPPLAAVPERACGLGAGPVFEVPDSPEARLVRLEQRVTELERQQ